MTTKDEHNDKSRIAPPHQSNVRIIGGSILRSLNTSILRRNLKHKVSVKTFPGARLEDMEHYIKSTLSSSPEYLVIHVGTNDLKYESSQIISDKLRLLDEQVGNSLLNRKIIIPKLLQELTIRILQYRSKR